MSTNDETDEPLDPAFEAELDERYGRPCTDETAKQEITELLREVVSYGKKKASNQTAKRVPGQIHYCANGHGWHDPEKAAKCCKIGWRPILLPTGRLTPDGEGEIWEKDFVRDYEAFTPLGDEFEKMAKKGNKHSLGDELFGKVKK